VECHHGIGFNIVGLKTFICSCLSFLGINLAFWGMTYLKYSYQAIVIKFPLFISICAFIDLDCQNLYSYSNLAEILIRNLKTLQMHRRKHQLWY
jgi:hypothetical protein